MQAISIVRARRAVAAVHGRPGASDPDKIKNPVIGSSGC
jgi:hypothetical protein